MRGRAQFLAVALLTALLVPEGATAERDGDLDMFRLTAAPSVVEGLVRAGYDVAAARPAPGPALEADLVLSPAEAETLRATGLSLHRWRNVEGRDVLELARSQAGGGYSVWRSWDEDGGIADELSELARAHPDLVEHRVIGHSVEGREIVALRVTAGAGSVPAGTRPAVLHLSAQHAREWISVEINRRILRAYVDGYGTDPGVTRLLATTELWFVVVANPDGYQRTFDEDRLWRKNNRDNDGNGRLNIVDGVDLNRNFPDHFAYDPEGSSPRPESGTYRGPTAGSEPETRALMDLAAGVHFNFALNYHSYGKLLLYPFGWQDHTPTTDQPIYEALAGTATNPAIPGYHPMPSTELYVTNGETGSWAHAAHGTLSFTPELGEGLPGNGFLFPDNEALVRQEYELNRPFALDVARSAADPAHPVSHLGNQAPPITIDSFATSHGDPQLVQARAARHLGEVTLRYRVSGGPERAAAAVEWDGGTRYGDTGDVHYRLVRGQVTGTAPGDSVEAWFEAGGVRSEEFTFTVAVSSPRPVLVVAGGDLAPPSSELPVIQPDLPVPGLPQDPGPAPGAGAGAVLDALAAAGIAADLYDVEAQGRRSPDPLGVLGHYGAVVWVTPGPSGMVLPGVASRLALEESMAARNYLNERGRLLYLGREAGRPYAEGDEYDPAGDRPCNPFDRGEDGCTILSDDFFQYWLGAYEREQTGGREVDGVDVPFEGMSFGLGSRAGPVAAAFRPTTEALDPAAYPHLEGRASARYRHPARPARADAAGVTTGRALLLGFSLEDVTGVDARTDVVRRALAYLLG
ncbi:MAG: M14 family metallopeptidase [Actinomycetota bacterium]|nr:M14 family metallopeptidase [Actinomycetota bacterium]